jgi:hypothetical protein
MLTPGTRILTPSDRPGTIHPAPWIFEGHLLVLFEDGQSFWIREDLLRPMPEGWKPAKKSRKTVAK